MTAFHFRPKRTSASFSSMASSTPTTLERIARPKPMPGFAVRIRIRRSERFGALVRLLHANPAPLPTAPAFARTECLARTEGRPADGSIPKPTPRDHTVLRLKAQGISNRGIGGRLGLSEMMIRKILRRLGWQPAPEATLPLLPKADAPAKPATISDSSADQISLPAAPPPPPQRKEPESKQAAQSFDRNPLDRSMDRLLAAWGCSTTRCPCLLQHRTCRAPAFYWPSLHWSPVDCCRRPRKFMAVSRRPSMACALRWSPMFC